MNVSTILGGVGGVAIALAVATSAHATYFSFASDVNQLAPTFGGTAGSNGAFTITDFSRPNTYSLVIDDNNGPLPSIPIPVEFHASLTASAGQSTQVAGTLFNHTYRVTGTFGFFDSMGVALLTAQVGPVNGGVLTVPGTSTGWSSSGAVLGSDSFSQVTYTVTQALINRLGGAAAAAQYGLFVGSSVNPDDFGFTLTAMSLNAGGAIGINAGDKTPTGTWRAESSFSGSAVFIPSPGAFALLGFGGAMALRRHRSRAE